MSLCVTLQRRLQRPHLDYKKPAQRSRRCLIEVKQKTLPGVTKHPLQWSKIIQKLLIKDITLLRM